MLEFIGKDVVNGVRNNYSSLQYSNQGLWFIELLFIESVI